MKMDFAGGSVKTASMPDTVSGVIGSQGIIGLFMMLHWRLSDGGIALFGSCSVLSGSVGKNVFPIISTQLLIPTGPEKGNNSNGPVGIRRSK
jgi:hypothetical protein